MSLEAKNISLKYDKMSKYIIDNESINFKIGKINIILGQNGCGKSTLFKAFSRHLKPSNGSILLNNKNINDLPIKTFSKEISILFQENKSNLDLTTREILEISRYGSLSFFEDLSEKDDEIIENAMLITNTKKFEHEPIKNLSSGQRQLIWIAMLISQNSDIIFFDEPTTYLDLKNQYEVMNCIEKINKELNKTVIIILHDINLAIQYADYIFMMKNGKIKYSGTIDEVITTNNIKDIFDINVSIIKNKGQTFICPLKN